MLPRISRRQSVFFGLALALPTVATLALGVRLIREGRRLAMDNVLQERLCVADQIGGELTTRLEQIKLETAGVLATGRGSTTVADRGDVMLVGWIRDGRLVLPWDVGSARAPVERLGGPEQAFQAALARGERAEFAERNLSDAIDAYRTAHALAPGRSEADDADLHQARVIVKKACACTGDARSIYRRLLSSPTLDDQGVPMAFYAARQLIDAKEESAPVLDMLASRQALNEWLPPAARYQQRDLLNAVAATVPGAAERQRAQALGAALQPAIAHVDEMLALQRNFTRIAPDAGQPGASHEPVWMPFVGASTWLVSEAPSIGRLEPFAIAVAAEPILEAAAADHAAGGAAPHLTFTPGSGDLVGRTFPDLRIAFGAVDDSAVMRSWIRQRTFYIASLVAILVATVGGGYLVWDGVRRELRLAELRSQFVASVSHELKTPLTAIRMFAETLHMERVTSAETRAQYLETIVHESERLTRFVDNVLDFSAMERGGRPLRLAETPLAPLIRDAAGAMQYPLARQGFDLRVSVVDDLPDVRVDADGIRQVVFNLLNNAMKYSRDRRELELNLQRVNGDAVIAVTDHGIGIPASEMPRIFGRFYRANVPENSRIPGTGLGLALVDQIVKAHGGRVDVQSTVGVGSTFAVHLPLAPGGLAAQG